jgi:uncharacterized protein YbjT (DUF2867 family)
MSDADIIVVAGATGNTGSGVATALLARGRRVRALVREESRAEALREQGAEIAVVDLDDPTTLSDALMDGATAVYFVTWNGPSALQQSRNLLETIVRSETNPRVVRLSAFGTPQSRIISELARCEEELEASGLSRTILKPTFFMQNVTMAAPSVQEQGAVYWDWGSGKAGMVDVRDVVDCAVAVLTGEVGDADGETFVLTGPTAIGFDDVAAILSGVVGRTVEYVPVSHEASREALISMGVPEWIASGYAELGAGFEHGFADLTTPNVERLSGHEPRAFEEFAREHARVFTRERAPVA